MVADKHMNMDAFLRHLAQLFAERMVLPFALVANEILHPEIEHVA